MSEKKVVLFESAMFIPSVGQMAILHGIENHPKLGNPEMVYTSKVVDVRDDGNTIETKNTIYKKKGDAIEE